MPRLYRKQPDSSGITEPRVMVRVLAEPGHLEQTVRCYESLTQAKLDMDIDAREAGIRIVAVGPFLILELDPARGDGFELARKTAVTMVFADLGAAVERSLALGAELVSAPSASAIGRGAHMRHPDGLFVEYLEHRPSAYDADTPGL